MNPRRPVLEVMKRTWRNFEFIDKRCSLAGPYEDVQLLNSFLGAFIHVKENYHRHIPERLLPLDGWPAIHTHPDYRAPRNLRQLVRLLRNGIAHGNVEFTADLDNRIDGIRIWNFPPKSRRKSWESTMSRADMRALLKNFVDLMTPILKKYERPIY
jgi:hypothetical protein